jgi:hypothetical protein
MKNGAITKANAVLSSIFPKHITTNVELWIRNSGLQFRSQLYDVFTAVKEENWTPFCIPERREGGIVYLLLAAKWVFKIVGDKNPFLKELWKYCPSYIEDLNFEEGLTCEIWYAREKRKRQAGSGVFPQ